MTKVTLLPLENSDREQFIKDNQEAFRFGAMEEFGMRDDHMEEPGEIISRAVIDASIDGGQAFRIVHDSRKVGGVVLYDTPKSVHRSTKFARTTRLRAYQCAAEFARIVTPRICAGRVFVQGGVFSWNRTC